MARRVTSKFRTKDISAAASWPAGRYSDGGGLYLVVSKSGSLNWVFLYDFAGKRREKGLGKVADPRSFKEVDLDKVRAVATACRDDLKAGRDPLAKSEPSASESGAEVKATPTFWSLAQDVLATVEASGKNPKHRQQWRNTLKDYAAPLHSKPVNAISTDDVAGVLAPLWRTKPETASRLRGRIERILSVAKAKGFRFGENPATWRDNLEPILGKRRKLARGHHAALAFQDVADFVGALRASEGVAAVALEFTILTAARTGEVIGARWPEFNLGASLWTVPAQRMKAEREHRVPLSARAVAILEAMRKLRRDGSDIVFPGQSEDGCLSNMAMAAVLKRMKRDDITVHGFRSSFRDWAGEVSSFPNEVCEMALAHAIGSEAEAAYRRGDLFEKRRAMMEEWAAYCEPVMAPPGLASVAGDDSPKRGRGRPKGSKTGTSQRVRDQLAAKATAEELLRLGLADNEGQAATAARAELETLRVEFSQAVAIESGNALPSQDEHAGAQRGPDPDETDDGFPNWPEKADIQFLTKDGRRRAFEDAVEAAKAMLAGLPPEILSEAARRAERERLQALRQPTSGDDDTRNLARELRRSR
ncbi:integrase [Bosea sp. BE271]|uniref:tyrosine-type recombinase/integrase n=1 Tax=Bosea TaxID=85413 RepID=UPI0028585FB9|nr:MULTISPECIES: integrase arm-type DNA-binding domain-containing protein [Bosea]MDR6827195.1 integrase [Bosea robiniae]MDR6893905.1 integrase [Bosea sp. BE109]MDR7137300.1 integrase [Bosea sp. BE168]MDR7174000.1 integrase [Bosea sp. BE271]